MLALHGHILHLLALVVRSVIEIVGVVYAVNGLTCLAVLLSKGLVGSSLLILCKLILRHLLMIKFIID